ncbi:MAG: N-acetylmuramic acid 6-phosphate etherase [Planctomycetes bacterium]|nr:N-acetylmuramic acid 6-phosphate etherase [Planctomycetota bacterium]
MAKPELDGLTTEAQNPKSLELDRLPTLLLLQLMNDEDRKVPDAVARVLPAIAVAVDAIAARLRAGGRLLYVGAGTSGRLGVLDAAECPPTFSTDPAQVVGIIAGGPSAFLKAVEGAEDSAELGGRDLQERQLTARDAVVGIAASGRTPYVIGALDHARQVGAFTAAVVCNAGSPVAAAAEVPIEVVVGPEVLTGSTRLKAGTAQKLVLNMLTTGAFVRLHKVYGNLMVDVQATNAKLQERSVRIVMQASARERTAAEAALRECGGEVKTAIVALRRCCPAPAARARLQAHGGSVRLALESA